MVEHHIDGSEGRPSTFEIICCFVNSVLCTIVCCILIFPILFFVTFLPFSIFSLSLAYTEHVTVGILIGVPLIGIMVLNVQMRKWTLRNKLLGRAGQVGIVVGTLLTVVFLGGLLGSMLIPFV